MEDKPRILGVELGTLGRALERSFQDAGFDLRLLVADLPVTDQLRSAPAQLLLVGAEVGSPSLTRLLDALAADVALSALPVVLLAQDTSERRFLKGARAGIVELLPRLLPAPAYVARVKALLHELPQRSGTTSGEADRAELQALLRHVERTRRSGALRVDSGTRQAAHALFVRGEVRNARAGDATGEDALRLLLDRNAAPWRFTEMGGGGGEGHGVVLDVPVSAPRAPPVLAQSHLAPSAAASGAPAVPALSPPAPVAPPAAAPPTLRPAKKDALRALVVDDDPLLCRMFSVLFERNGFEVTTARDGFAGYEAARAGNFDLVTADLKLPRLDGWGMLRLLREDLRTREVPVAFLSCDDPNRNRLSELESGAQAYLAKDMGLDALMEQLQAMLAPRIAFRRDLQVPKPMRVAFGALGTQWVLRELGRAGFTGRVQAKDAWARYELVLVDGQLHHAFADSGRQQVIGEHALMAWLVARAPEGGLDLGSFLDRVSLTLPLEVALERALDALNERERGARQGALKAGGQVEVNSNLYQLYAQVAPEAWQSVARLVCQQNVPPAEVAARVDLPATEVREALFDLFRRGVVTVR